MSNEQREQSQPQAPAPQQQAPDPKAAIVKQGALAAIGGAFSGAARAVVTHLLGDDS